MCIRDRESGETNSGIAVFAEDNVIRIYYDRVLEKSTFDDNLGVTASDSIPDERHEIRQGKITVETHYVGGSLDGQGESGDVYFVWHNRNMVDLAVTLKNLSLIHISTPYSRRRWSAGWQKTNFSRYFGKNPKRCV